MVSESVSLSKKSPGPITVAKCSINRTRVGERLRGTKGKVTSYIRKIGSRNTGTSGKNSPCSPSVNGWFHGAWLRNYPVRFHQYLVPCSSEGNYRGRSLSQFLPFQDIPIGAPRHHHLPPVSPMLAPALKTIPMQVVSTPVFAPYNVLFLSAFHSSQANGTISLDGLPAFGIIIVLDLSGTDGSRV